MLYLCKFSLYNSQNENLEYRRAVSYLKVDILSYYVQQLFKHYTQLQTKKMYLKTYESISVS